MDAKQKELMELIKRANTTADTIDVLKLMTALFDSKVWVPVDVLDAKSGKKKLSFFTPKIITKGNTPKGCLVKPAVITVKTGDRYLPTYIVREHGAQLTRGYSWIELPFSSCCEMALKDKSFKTVVVNPYINGYISVIPEDMLTVLLTGTIKESDLQ